MLIGLPIVVFMGVLVLFGITWMFHHHHWRPFVGIVLFGFGMIFLFSFARFSAQPTVVSRAPQTMQSRPNDRDPDDVSRSIDEEESNQALNPAENYSLPSSRDRSRSRDIGSGTARTASDRTPLPAEADSAGAVNSRESTSAVVAPAPTSPAPDKRPDWVDRSPGLEQFDNGQQAYVAAAASGPYATRGECQRAIYQAENEIVARYVDEFIPEAAGHEVLLEPGYIRLQIERDQYWEKVEASVGPMNQLHVKLVFDSRVLSDLGSRARAMLVAGRLTYAAGGTAVALLVLGGIYSILNRRTTPRALVSSNT